jgi:glycosyltransferase involved in cell wall biosynthesis
MRVVAVLAAYNEERFIRGCLEHLFGQGVDVYLIDNDSSDGTRDIAEEYVGRGLIGIERLARNGNFSLRGQLRRKEELYQRLAADWFVHVDADEIHQTADGVTTLAESFAQSEAAGYNAVNFLELTFVPTHEDADHDHSLYRETMRWYYPYLPVLPHRLNAWKRQPGRVDLVSTGGHRVQFDGVRMDPKSLLMRHYLFLSRAHAVRKYTQSSFDSAECADGWHGWRQRVDFRTLPFASRSELKELSPTAPLDASEPLTMHLLERELACSSGGLGSA